LGIHEECRISKKSVNERMTNKMKDSKNIPYRLIQQKEETNSLVIILPGAGYTTHAPLLYYTTGVFYKKGFDVLHLNYTFSREEISALDEREFARDVQLTIDNAIKEKKYSHYYIVAKSIGTKALSYILEHTIFNSAKVVWLTPLLQNDAVFHAMVNSKNKGLCIFGESDHVCFIVERYEKLKNNQNLLLKVVNAGNHNLELDHEPMESIELLKNVISDINDFIN
jgi:hypothetical protein